MKQAVSWLLAALLAYGCAGTSPPTHFYTLEATGPAPPVADMPRLALGLGPIVLPDTLDRPQIVSRGAPYSVELGEFNRWAGNLKAEVGRLMAGRLMASLGTDRVFLHPWPRHRELDRQVRVDVLRFDGRFGGEAKLEGTWTLLDGEGRRELKVEAFSLHHGVAGTEYSDMVAAMSALAARLADRIGEAVAGEPG